MYFMHGPHHGSIDCTCFLYHFSLHFSHCFGCGSDSLRTWFGRGSDVVRTCVFGCGADSLAEVKGKWFPAIARCIHCLMVLHVKRCVDHLVDPVRSLPSLSILDLHTLDAWFRSLSLSSHLTCRS